MRQRPQKRRSVMIPGYNRKSLAIGIPGIILQILVFAAALVLLPKVEHSSPAIQLSVSIGVLSGLLLGTILLIVGLCYYSKAKGYTPVLGLLGLFSWVGLLILAVLPDRAKQ